MLITSPKSCLKKYHEISFPHPPQTMEVIRWPCHLLVGFSPNIEDCNDDELPPSTNHHTRLQQETSSRGWRENHGAWSQHGSKHACFKGKKIYQTSYFIVMICGFLIVPFLLLFFEEMQLWYNLQGYPLRFFEARTSTSSPKAHPMISCI